MIVANSPNYIRLIESQNRNLYRDGPKALLILQRYVICITPAERQSWRAGIYDQIRAVMSRQGGLRIDRMCQENHSS